MGNCMINYSVYMLPNTIDVSKPAKAYAKAQVKEVMTFRKFVEHIAEHGGHNRGQVKGVLSDMCACLVEQLLEGKKIMLDDLGNFWVSLTSEGAESSETFTAKNITGVRIIFTPGDDFTNLLGRAEFNPVASRIVQNASYKAEKKGKDTVDIAAAKNKSTSTEPAPEEPTNPDNTPTGGGSDNTGGNDTDNGSDNSGSTSGNGEEDTPPFS